MDRSANVRVVVVEDDEAMRLKFVAAISGAANMELAAAFDNGRQALQWLEHHAPDVLLTDLGLPDLPGLAVIAYCAQRHPRADIRVITMYEDEAHVLRSLEAGASGYLLKDSLNDEIVERVHELASGGSPMTPVIARLVLRRLNPRQEGGGNGVLRATEFSPLSERELGILTRIAQGFSYAEIAEVEKISRHTVHTHIKNIYSKLSVHSRSEAVFEAGRLGLIDSSLRT